MKATRFAGLFVSTMFAVFGAASAWGANAVYTWTGAVGADTDGFYDFLDKGNWTKTSGENVWPKADGGEITASGKSYDLVFPAQAAEVKLRMPDVGIDWKGKWTFQKGGDYSFYAQACVTQKITYLTAQANDDATRTSVALHGMNLAATAQNDNNGLSVELAKNVSLSLDGSELMFPKGFSTTGTGVTISLSGTNPKLTQTGTSTCKFGNLPTITLSGENPTVTIKGKVEYTGFDMTLAGTRPSVYLLYADNVTLSFNADSSILFSGESPRFYVAKGITSSKNLILNFDIPADAWKDENGKPWIPLVDGATGGTWGTIGGHYVCNVLKTSAVYATDFDGNIPLAATKGYIRWVGSGSFEFAAQEHPEGTEFAWKDAKGTVTVDSAAPYGATLSNVGNLHTPVSGNGSTPQDNVVYAYIKGVPGETEPEEPTPSAMGEVTASIDQRKATVSGTVASLGSGETKVYVKVGEADPERIATLTTKSPSRAWTWERTLANFGDTLSGTVYLVNGPTENPTQFTSDAVAFGPLTAVDNAVYTWSGTGAWTDAANWTADKEDRQELPPADAAVTIASGSVVTIDNVVVRASALTLASDAQIVFKGAAPSLTVASLSGSGTVTFEIPLGGWASAPLVGTGETELSGVELTVSRESPAFLGSTEWATSTLVDWAGGVGDGVVLDPGEADGQGRLAPMARNGNTVTVKTRSLPDVVLAAIPAVENATLVSVAVGDVVIAAEPDGTYLIPGGSDVTVTFKADKGYGLTKSSVVFNVGFGETAQIPTDLLPQAGELGDLVINEVMASNETTLATPDGAEGLDWVEIHNPGDAAIPLDGWKLTDDPDGKASKRKPILGAIEVPAGGYLVVFLDKDKADWADGVPHAAIGLSASGESIALVSPDDVVVSRYDFGPQFKDVSFGPGDAPGGIVYFESPTPGAANGDDGKLGPSPAVNFSERHGWKTEPFSLTLSCDDPNAKIYYTFDGTSPTTASAEYKSPIVISQTTVVRARAVVTGGTRKPIHEQDYSATYLFAYDIAHQCADGNPPEGFPATKEVNNQAFRYGMRPKVYADNANRPEIPARLYDGFTNSIRAVSLVIDPANLFNASTGIYVNARNDGIEWERQTMVEQINPLDPADEYSVSCGLRIRGGFSRSESSTKHSFRLFFRSGYGYSKLQHALFGDEGTDEFDKIDLRTDQNQTWAKGNSNQETLIHELFSRDSQRDMNLSYHRSQYFHLFINGVYWGIYMYEERCSPEYAASYFGGNEEDYDVFRTQNEGGQYVTGVTDGDPGAVTNFWDEITRKQGYGEGHEANYNRVLGRNPDGTRNPDYPVYLNETNLIGFVLITHYTADTDSPANGGRINNLCSFRNRNDEGGFRFNRHDSEMTFQWSEVKDKGYDNTSYGTREKNCTTFNPLGLHYELCANAEYKTHFVDQVYRHCIRKGGALTRDASLARFGARMTELDSAIVCEGARWGIDIDGRDREQNWMKMSCSGCLNFISNRTDQLIATYRGRGWYPSVDAPTALDKDGETVTDGTVFAEGEKVTLANADKGTVYYTLDGSDPRLSGGTKNANALVYAEPFAPPAGVSQVRARILTASGEWSALEEVSVKGSSTGGADPKTALRVAEVMSSCPGDGDSDDYLVLTNLADEAVSLADVRIVAWNAKKKSEADPSITLTFGATASIPAGETLTLTAADFAGGKLTNSDVGIRLYDISGGDPVLFQDCYVSADWFGGNCDGKGGAFVALEFGAVVKAESQWKSSLEPEVPQGDDVEGDGFLFYLAGEYATPQVLAPTGSSCRIVLDGATLAGGLQLPAGVACELVCSNDSTLASISGSSASLTVTGPAAVRVEGPDTLVSVSNLIVEAGVFGVRSTGVSVTKTPVVRLTGDVRLKGGELSVDLDTVTENQIYGIFLANKNMNAKFTGGAFTAKVGGTKSAALYIDKGSTDATFEDGVTVSAVLTGPEARLLNIAGNIKMNGGDFTVTAQDAAVDARVFKTDKKITVKGGCYDVDVPTSGSEIFSAETTITVSDGVFELVAADDCFNANTNITVSGGLIYAVSTANDVFDSNGDMTLSGGTILAFATGAGHEAFDVEPMATEENGIPHVLYVNGGTIFATGGAGTFWPASVVTGDGVNVYQRTELATADYSEKYVSLVGGDAENKTTTAVKLPALAGDAFALFATVPGGDGSAPAVSDAAPEKGDQDFHGLYVWSEEIDPATEIIVVGPDGVTNTEEFVSVEDAVTNRPYGSLVEIPVVIEWPLAVTLEPGVKVLFAEGQSFGEGALTFKTPDEWYDVHNEGVQAWIELNDLAKPEFATEGTTPGEEPIEVGAGDAGAVTLRVANVRPHLIYGVKASAALSALAAAEPANWTQADGEGHLPNGALTMEKPSPSAGFFTVTVTDDPRVLEKLRS